MELNFSHKLLGCMLSQSSQVLQMQILKYYFHAKGKKTQLLNISIYYKIMAATLNEQNEAYPAF